MVKVVAPPEIGSQLAKSDNVADQGGRPTNKSSPSVLKREPATSIENSSSDDSEFGTEFADVDNLLANLDESDAKSFNEAPRARSSTAANDVEQPPVDPGVEPSEVEEADAERPVLPNEQWVSDETRNRQKLLLVIGGAVGALLIAVIMITYLVVQMSRPAQTIAEGDQQSQNDANTNADNLGDDGEGRLDADSTSESDNTDNGNDTNTIGDQSDTNTNEQTPNNSDDENTDDNNTNENVDSGTGNDTTDGSNDTSDESNDGQPPGFQLEARSSNASDILNDPILGGLGNLDRFVEDNGSNNAREAAQRQRRESGWTIYDAEAPFVERPREISLNIETQLDVELLELKQDGIPLFEFVDLMSRLSGIPIKFHPNVLKTPVVTDNLGLDVHVVEQSIGDALREELRKVGLNYREGAYSLEIITPNETASLTDRSYPVADLLDGFPNKAEDLTLIITALVEPRSWEEQGGLGELYVRDDNLVVRHYPNQQEQVAIFLNQLRLVRGLPSYDDTISTERDLKPFAIANACLDEKFTLEIYKPIQLSLVAERLNETANITMLVDWESLANEGWNWDTELPLVVDDQSVDFALRRLAVSLDVAYRIVGPREFELISKSKYRRTKQIAFFNCAPLLDAGIDINAIADQIRSVFPGDPETDVVYPFYYDGDSKYLVARLTPNELVTLHKFMGAWERTALTSSR